MASKKIMIPNSLKNEISTNLEEANSETIEKPQQSRVEPVVSEQPKKPKQIVSERSADRGPLMNVHVTMDVKYKLERIKLSRRNAGIKITTDTIIFEAIEDYIKKHESEID